MDFRTDKCRWCLCNQQPIEKCASCPKYLKHTGKKKGLLMPEDFCIICMNRNNDELKIYCERNRYFQRDPEQEDDFECYKFCFKAIQ